MGVLHRIKCLDYEQVDTFVSGASKAKRRSNYTSNIRTWEHPGSYCKEIHCSLQITELRFENFYVIWKNWQTIHCEQYRELRICLIIKYNRRFSRNTFFSSSHILHPNQFLSPPPPNSSPNSPVPNYHSGISKYCVPAFFFAYT